MAVLIRASRGPISSAPTLDVGARRPVHVLRMNETA